MNFSDASVLITGASRGIGQDIAIYFAKKTNRPLILLARNKNDLRSTKERCEEYGAGHILVLPCNAADEAAVNSLAIPEDFPPSGIIINNAGAFLLKPLEQTSGKEMENQLKTNLLTAFNVTKRFLPLMKKLDRGLIINICSTASLRGFDDSGAYTASKHALLGFTRSLREELMEKNIAVTAVNLGQTQSTSWEESGIDPELLIDPKDVADLLVFLSSLSPRTVVEEIIIKPQHGRVPPM